MTAGFPTFRAFIAINVPAAVRADLAAVVHHLRGQDTDAAVRWVSADAMHITLAFLGEIAETTTAPLLDALRLVSAGVHPFTVRVGQLGTFGDRHRRGGAQVVWAGLDGDLDALRESHEIIAAAVRSLGLGVESRAFRPHITLGRVKRGRRWRLTTADIPTLPTVEFRVNHVSLMESRLGRGPAEYRERAAVELTGNGCASRIMETE